MRGELIKLYDLERSTFGRVKEDRRHREAWEPWALRVPLSLKQIKEDSVWSWERKAKMEERDQR